MPVDLEPKQNSRAAPETMQGGLFMGKGPLYDGGPHSSNSAFAIAADREERVLGQQPVLDDPLLSRTPMPLLAMFYPLGFAVEIATNHQAVLDAAHESWGHLKGRHSAPVLRVRIGITDGGPAECPPAPVARAQSHLLSMVADAGNYAHCDMHAGFAFAWLTGSVVRYPAYLRYHFLEAMALVLISTSYAVPIHAACVGRHGRGLLLCGESGAGKSTLSYACARAGWTFTSDDASYILRDAGHLRVIGNSHQFRFRPSALNLFPELAGRAVTPRAEGKPSIEVPTADLAGILTAQEASVFSIVFLNRQPAGGAELIPLDNQSALKSFEEEPFFTPEMQEKRRAALRHLAATEVYELRYSGLQAAVARLERLVGSQGTPTA